MQLSGGTLKVRITRMLFHKIVQYINVIFLNISQVSSTWQKYLLANAKNVNRAEQQCTIEEKLAPSPVWGSEIVRRHKIAAPEMLLWILRISSQICFGFLPESYCEKVREAQDCSS